MNHDELRAAVDKITEDALVHHFPEKGKRAAMRHFLKLRRTLALHYLVTGEMLTAEEAIDLMNRGGP